MEKQTQNQPQTTNPTQHPTNDNHRKYEKSPMVIGQKVTVSDRCFPILSGIYKLPEGAVLRITDILAGPNGRSLYEVLGHNTAGAAVTFVVSPKMVRRVKALSAPPAHILAERLSADFHRPQHQFKGLAAVSAAKLTRRTNVAGETS